MRIFLVGGAQMALAYFREFGNALAYWNYLTLGDGITELQNLGIDPKLVEMYEFKFVEDEDPDFMASIVESNKSSHERRAHELQEAFDEIPHGPCKEQGDGSKVLAKATPDPRSNSPPDIS